MTSRPIHIVGGGLAGSEAAWQIANRGIPVILHEMRGVRGTDAHKTDGLAELVCSNSFRSDDSEHNAVGLIHAEMRMADSLIMRSGDANQVPAGGALAVDRDGFSDAVSKALHGHPLIEIVREEVTGQDVKALLLHRLLTTELGIGVAQVAVVEVGVASLPLGCVEVCSQVLGDEPVEQHPKDVSLEVPSVDTAAKVVGDSPDGLVKL